MHKLENKSKLIKLIGTLFIILAAACAALLAVMQIDELSVWYDTWQDQLVILEERVASLDNKWLVVLAVFALFTLKSVFPPITISAICFISGVVLPGYAAIFVNLFGLVWLMTIKYFWGKHLGGGNARRIVKMNNDIREFLESDGTGNPYMLFLFRLIPSFPLNSVSQLYGAMNFKYIDYILISIAGFAYKLISYTIIGRNIYNPLSASFLVPIIVLFLVSGSLLLGMNYFIILIAKHREEKEQLAPKKIRTNDKTTEEHKNDRV